MNLQLISLFYKILGNSKKYFYTQLISNLIHSLAELINIFSLTAIVLLITDVDRFENLLIKYLPNFLLNLFNDKLNFTFFLITLFLVFVATTVIKLLLKWITIHYNLKIEKNINDRIYRNYLNKNYLDILKIDSFKIFNILNYQVSRFVNSYVGPVCTIINSLGFLILILAIMFYFSGLKILGIISILFIITSLIYYLIRNKIEKLDKRFTSFNLLRQSLLNETVYNIKYLKISKIYEPLLVKFKKINEVLLKSISIRQISMHIAKPVIEIFFLSIVTIYFLFILSNKEIDIVGIIPELSFYIISFYRIVPAVQQIYQSVVSIKGSESAFNDLLDKNINLTKKSYIPVISNQNLELKKKIILKNIYFFYTKNKFVFKNLNLNISSNNITCIYGASGIGKSTLTDIIMGLINPNKGKVLVDGHILNKKNINSWHDKIGYIGQSFYLLNDGLLKNIIFRSKQKSISKAKKIAKIFFKKDELKTLVNKKTVGENGKLISFGQKQRLLLSRLIYQNKKIIILDEPTSNLDKKNAEIFKNIVSKLKKSKTIIIITHDQDIKKYSDKIINLEAIAKKS